MKFIATTALAVLLACPAWAEWQKKTGVMHCNTTDIVTALLDGKYGEKVVIASRDGAGNTVKIWANPETLTWTVTVDLGELTCSLSAGSEFGQASHVIGDPA